jgi:sulfate transport system ATP-binding protein/putative spermidine/putrescine transport system ATP-binding protein
MSLVEDLSKKYKSFDLQIPRWEIPDQGITALWGPSGSGKTTVFRILLGLESCPGMKWVYRGKDLAALDIQDRKIGVVFQTYELFPHMTAQENILFAAQVRKIDMAKAESKLHEYAARLNLNSCLNTNAARLSGGEKQRVALARALMSEPQFLFLDEPFSALDEDLRDEARALVKKVVEDSQIPTLLVTHDIRDLKALNAARITKIQNGKLVEGY